MAIIITDECINCGACEPECPNTAIYEGGVIIKDEIFSKSVKMRKPVVLSFPKNQKSLKLDHPNTSAEPPPKTYFYGYGPDGNLNFALMYWTTFSDTLKTDSEIALLIFKALKEEGIQAPAPVRRIIQENPGNAD